MARDLAHLPARDPKGATLVVVESPRGSPVKLKYDPALGVFTVSRPLPWGLVYPFDWGFVPSTNASDGDPLDAMVLWDVPSAPGVVIPCRPLGALFVEQNASSGKGRERNDRLLMIPLAAPRQEQMRDINDLHERLRQELIQFFTASTALEGKDIKVLGWGSAADAERLIDEAEKR